MKLREWREKRGLSQEELSESVGVHENTIRKWEKGYREPRASDIAKLAAALHVTEAELLNGPESKEIKITLHYSEMPKESDINMNGNEFDLYMSGNGNLGIKGAAKFATEEDIDGFLARARAELVQGLAFQRSRGALATA